MRQTTGYRHEENQTQEVVTQRPIDLVLGSVMCHFSSSCSFLALSRLSLRTLSKLLGVGLTELKILLVIIFLIQIQRPIALSLVVSVLCFLS